VSTQDRTVAAAAGWIGVLTVIIAALTLVVVWRVYRGFTDRAHPAWILPPALDASGLLSCDWDSGGAARLKSLARNAVLGLDGQGGPRTEPTQGRQNAKLATPGADREEGTL
jgi:hypothetical protein